MSEDSHAPNKTDEPEPQKPFEDWERQHSRLQLIFNGVLMMTAILGTLTIGYQIYDAAAGEAANTKRIEDAFGMATKSVTAAERAAKAAEDAVAIAERNRADSERRMASELRAWVGPGGGITMTPEIAADTTPRVRAILVNTGRTPALALANNVGVSGSKPTPELIRDLKGKNLADLPASRSVVFPGQSVEAGITLPKVTSEQVTSLKEGQTALYFFGNVTYDDVFGGHNLTTFCYRLMPPDLKTMRLCEYGNYAR